MCDPKNAMNRIRRSQSTQSHPPMPMPLRLMCSVSGPETTPPNMISAELGSSAWPDSSWTMVVAESRPDLCDGSGMADPRVEHGVEQVDDEVHEHVDHRDHGDQRLGLDQ